MSTALVLFLCARPAHASIAFFMEEPYGHLGAWSPTGHAAIYLDHICSTSYVELRLCRHGETGVVISRYHKVHKDDWLAIGLVPYLYAVDSLQDAPVELNSRDEETAVRSAYWRTHLLSLAPPKNGCPPGGNWTQLVGAAFDRTIHVFEVETTPEQDQRFIRAFNERRNRSHFNFFFHNCADFSRVVLNIYFPRAIQRNYVADFGLTTPKQVARDLVEYGRSHPHANVRQYVIPQIAGNVARSHRIRGVSESLLKTKRWLIPLLILEPEVIGVAAVAYYGNGRIHFEDEAPTFPIPDVGADEAVAQPQF